jgi:hypothetical protein
MTGRAPPNNPSTCPNGNAPVGGTVQQCPAQAGTPKKTCTITSQTHATSPANRTRTKIGVGEEVDLTVTPGPATNWAITSGGGTLSSTSGGSTTLTGGDSAGSVTITATCPDCTCTITFTVVEPSWTMEKKAGTNLKHTNGHPDCGWQGTQYLHPNDVNFYRVETRELDSLSVATGCYNPSHHGKYHGGYPLPDCASSWFPVKNHTEAHGSEVGMTDQIYSGYPAPSATGTAPPFTVGSYYWPITWQWRVVGSANTHNFPGIRQEHEIFATGKCESRKGGHTESSMYNDPTSTY